MIAAMRVVALRRFPFKGLNGEILAEAALLAGLGIPGDRALGIKFADAPEGWQDKNRFLQLANTPALARLRIRWDESLDRLQIFEEDRCVVDAQGAARAREVEEFLAGFVKRASGRRPTLRLERAWFPDEPSCHLSLLSRASIRELERRWSTPLDEERFRMNVMLDSPDLPPFAEWDLVGQTCTLGSARIEISARLPRCAAPSANPQTGARDVNVCARLERDFGHHDLGVLARVVESGRVRTGDLLFP
jgi:hypothetical protein